MGWQNSTAYGLSTDRPDDWRDIAACRDHDPETWFPVGEAGPALAQTEQAKAICRRCPVVADCLTWAIDTREAHGVWGGMTPDERAVVWASGGTPIPTVQWCGTDDGYLRHRRERTKQCGPCILAHREEIRRRQEADWRRIRYQRLAWPTL